LVDRSWQINVDSLLVRAFNQLDHGSLKEADEAACEFRPDISVQVHLDILLRDHELHVDSLDGRQGAPIEQLLSREADADLQLKTLKIDVGVALSLHEALLELEVAAVERGSQVVRLENHSIVAHIVVEVD